MSDDSGGCDTEGHVWEIGPDGKTTKCTFCGKPSIFFEEQGQSQPDTEDLSSGDAA